MNKAVIYIRVSTEEQAKGFSPDKQKKDLLKFCEEENLERPSDDYIFDDSGFSAYETKIRREQFYNMIDFVEKNKIKHIVARDVKRLYRNLKNPNELFEELDGLEVWIHIMDDAPFNIGNKRHWKRIKRHLQEALDGWADSAEKGVLVTDGKNEAIELGYYPARPPLGYRNKLITEINAEGIEKHYVLAVFDEREEHSYKKVKKMMLETFYEQKNSLAETANIANSWGLVPQKISRKSNTRLTANSVRARLINPFYCGDRKWLGKIYHGGKHKALITKKQWLNIQEALRTRGRGIRKGVGGKGQLPFTYKGAISCFHCKTKKRDRVHLIADGYIYKDKRHIYYRCSMRQFRDKKGKSLCDSLIWKESEIDLAISDYISGLNLFRKEVMEWLEKKLNENFLMLEKGNEERLEYLNKELVKGKKQLHKYQRTILNVKSVEMRKAIEKDWAKEKDRVENLKEQIADLEAEDDGIIEEGMRVFKGLHLMGKNYLELSEKDKRLIIDAMFRDIVAIGYKEKKVLRKVLTFNLNEAFAEVVGSMPFRDPATFDNEKFLSKLRLDSNSMV